MEQKHFPSGQIPGPGLPKAARELCTALPANIKPLCSIQVSLMRGSSLSRLDLACWREVEVETGVVLRCRSETSAVVLVSRGGLCLAHGKPALCSAIATKGCWAQDSGQGWLKWWLSASNHAVSLPPILLCSLLAEPDQSLLTPRSCPRAAGKAVATGF